MQLLIEPKLFRLRDTLSIVEHLVFKYEHFPLCFWTANFTNH